MALSKGLKIAIGCGIAVVLAGGAVIVAVVGVAWWGTQKAKQMVESIEADTKATEAALEKANANEFTPPDDGVIREDRLLRFLAVRKTIHDQVYLKHKDMLETQVKKEQPDLSAMAKLPFLIGELRSAKALALAREGMSEREFSWLFSTVYVSLVTAGTAGDNATGVGQVIRTSSREAVEQAERAAAAAEANPDVPPELKRQAREAAERAREGAAAAEQSSAMLDVPAANLELFKKHREEILKYTMGGLELIPF